MEAVLTLRPQAQVHLSPIAGLGRVRPASLTRQGKAPNHL